MEFTEDAVQGELCRAEQKHLEGTLLPLPLHLGEGTALSRCPWDSRAGLRGSRDLHMVRWGSALLRPRLSGLKLE